MSDDTQIITDAKSFSGALTLEMTDEEIKKAFELIARIKERHQNLWRQKFPFDSDEMVRKLLAEFEDEVKTSLAEQCNVLATVSTAPLLNGDPPLIDIIGKLPGDYIYNYGMDHEKKEWEVKRTKKGDAYKGQSAE